MRPGHNTSFHAMMDSEHLESFNPDSRLQFVEVLMTYHTDMW